VKQTNPFGFEPFTEEEVDALPVDSDPVALDDFQAQFQAAMFDPETTPLIAFFGDEGTIGELWLRDGAITFEGNADESARIFFNNLKGHIEALLGS